MTGASDETVDLLENAKVFASQLAEVPRSDRPLVRMMVNAFIQGMKAKDSRE